VMLDGTRIPAPGLLQCGEGPWGVKLAKICPCTGGSFPQTHHAWLKRSAGPVWVDDFEAACENGRSFCLCIAFAVLERHRVLRVTAAGATVGCGGHCVPRESFYSCAE